MVKRKTTCFKVVTYTNEISVITHIEILYHYSLVPVDMEVGLLQFIYILVCYTKNTLRENMIKFL